MLTDEKTKFVERALRQMASFTFSCIASVVGGTPPRVVGSGLRLWTAGGPCLVTAARVASAAPQLSVSIDRVWSPKLLGARPELMSEGDDLAIYRLQSERHDRNESFWPIDRVDQNDTDLDSDFLVVHGFPLTTALESRVEESFAIQSFPYGSMSLERSESSWLGEHQFAIPFDPSTFDPASNVSLLSNAMLGSAVWRAGAEGCRPNEWSPLRSSLAGVVTGWDQERSVLIATRATRILKLMGVNLVRVG